MATATPTHGRSPLRICDDNTDQLDAFRIRREHLLKQEGPRPLHATHGPEVQRALDDVTGHDRTIKILGTVIVVLAVVLGYCLRWAELHGL